MSEPAPAPRPGRPRLRIALRVVAWALAVLPALAFLVLGWHKRWISDDGFINLRVAYNFVRGNGLVFNVGERVESFTSAGWVLLLSFAGLLRIPLEPAAVVLGLLLSLAGLVLAQLGAVRAWSERPLRTAVGEQWMLPLGALVFALLPPVWDHATAGLELGLVMAWLGLAFFLCVRFARPSAEPKPLPWATALVLGLGPLVRPELALFTLGMAVPLLIAVLSGHAGRRIKKLLSLAALIGAIPIAYQVFRMGYFATLTPNTAIAKESMVSNWQQGAHYFQNFFGLYHVLFPIGVLLVCWVLALVRIARRRQLALMIAAIMPVLIGAVYALYVIKLGGDFMHARMFLPALFCFLLPVAMVPASAAGAPAGMRAAIVTGGAAIAIWALVVATSVRVDRENQHGIGDERGWYARMADVENPVRVEDYAKFAFYTEGKRLHDLATNEARWVLIDDASAGRLNPAQRRMQLAQGVLPASSHVVVLRGALGILGFAAGPAVHVVDLHGLSDPLAARLEIAARGRPGHEKRLSNYWLVARYAAPTDKDDLRVVAARDALACGPLSELVEAVSGPISAGRFVRNLGASFRLQSLRIPSDPYAAKAELCAPGL